MSPIQRESQHLLLQPMEAAGRSRGPWLWRETQRLLLAWPAATVQLLTWVRPFGPGRCGRNGGVLGRRWARPTVAERAGARSSFEASAQVNDHERTEGANFLAGRFTGIRGRREQPN